MPTRLLVIGLDAFDRQLVTAWADDGTLPTLRRLLRSGVSCPVENDPGLYAGTAWVSLNTGVGPGRHRRFFRRQARSGEYLNGEFPPERIAVRPFWERLSAAGRRVAIIDAPMPAPAVALNGIQLFDWSTHEPNFERARSQPPRLVDELAERFGTLRDRSPRGDRVPAQVVGVNDVRTTGADEVGDFAGADGVVHVEQVPRLARKRRPARYRRTAKTN